MTSQTDSKIPKDTKLIASRTFIVAVSEENTDVGPLGLLRLDCYSVTDGDRESESRLEAAGNPLNIIS